MMESARGAYSLVLLGRDEMVAVRDPYGFRPLVVGNLKGATVVASETTALSLIGATYEREVEPGEILVVTRGGRESHFPVRAPRLAQCVFEHIYFARPDSIVFGRQVYEVRSLFGRQLAREAPVRTAM